MLFSFEKEPKRTRQTDGLGFAKTLHTDLLGNGAARADTNGSYDRGSRPQPLDGMPGW